MKQQRKRELLFLMCSGIFVTLFLVNYIRVRKASDSDSEQPVVDIFSLEQDDSRLIEYVRNNTLTPPSTVPKGSASGNFYSHYIWDLFKKKGKDFKGTFVEAGAYDGVAASNTNFLEGKGWKGVLVEPNPLLIPKLLKANRTSWISTACLSQSTRPENVSFYTLEEWPASAKVGSPLDRATMRKYGIDWVKNKTWVKYEMTCFPLYTIIKAAGEFEEIDFLSLDVEGLEIEILKNFPFDKLKIRAMVVEVLTFTEDQLSGLRSFMDSKGYEMKLHEGNDDFYVLKGEF